MELVALQGQTLPLGQGVDHHGGVLYTADIKGDGALHAVEIVVQTGGGGHKEGGGYPVQAQGAAQAVLKQALEQADGLLSLINAEQGGVPLRNGGTFHIVKTPYKIGISRAAKMGKWPGA